MARKKRDGWPEGLSDQEAIQRLETLCLGACDGIQDLADDARYKALRKVLLAREDLRPLAPTFVAAQPNLEAFVRHIRTLKDRTTRRSNVREAFKSLWGEVGGQDPVDSAGWTGRKNARQQAALARTLAPLALEALDRLIRDEENARGNGGPVDQDREQALKYLKELHGALGELIQFAEADKPLQGILKQLQSIKQEAKITLGKAAAAMPVTASALLAFGSVVGIADFFTGNVVVSLAAGGLAGNSIKDAMLKKDPKS